MAGMPSEKTFFSTVYFDGIIYTFGGYDSYEKMQVKSCEYYNVFKDEWFNSELVQGKMEFEMHVERS